MKQIPSDKYNVAWFTLAECVSRGEKVRAMSLYRLLAHSIKDYALTCQLKGDLLLAFQDTTAVELYKEAADLYIKDHRLLEAAGVFEHLLTLDPENCQYIKSLIKLYQSLKIDSKVATYIKQLFKDFVMAGDFDTAYNDINQIEEACGYTLTAIHQQFVLYLLQQKRPLQPCVVDYGKKIVERLINGGSNDLLQQFFSKIKLIDEEYYLMLCEYAEPVMGQDEI